MNINEFTHLHTHSVYSILDGENQLDAFVNRVKELGMKQCALTDHGTMMGVLEWYKKCTAADIKPVLGVEAYITNDPDGLEKSDRTKDNYHLVMLAENNQGLENLFHLVSNAQLQNMYYKPRISKKNLTPERTKGIIATSACLGNEINRVAIWDAATKIYSGADRMEEAARWYYETFEGRYYLEIQDNDDDEEQQKYYNEVLKGISKRNGIPMVITADAHYTTEEKSKTHAMLMAMQLGMTLEDYQNSGSMKYGPWFYIRSPQQMLDAAKKYDCEEAFWNTCEIGNKCNVTIELGKYKPPTFDITQESDYEEFLKEYNNE